MTVQIIRGSCRHALGADCCEFQLCVWKVCLLFKLQLLRAKEILCTEQVGQTQQFTCCLADTADRQQSASCWLGISLGWPTGLWVGRMLSQSPVPLSQMQTNPSLFISCFLSFIFPSFIHCYFFLVLLVQQPVVSSGCLSTVPANMIKNYFFCYFQVLVFGHIHVPNMIFLAFF